MADLPIQDIDMDQVMAMAAAQQRKVDAWCSIESTSDLAFIFTSYEEALREAGRAVADAWSAARVSVQSGLAVPARQVVREASAVSPPVVLKRGPSTGVVRPSSSTEKVVKSKIAPSGYLRDNPPSADCSHQLYAIILACLEQSPQTEDEKAALRAFVQQVAAKAERVTLQNAVRTWAELRIFSNELSLQVSRLTALPIAAFIRQHKTKVRALNSLRWLVKNLKLPFDLSLVVSQTGPRKVSEFGEGARQAPVLPPALVTELGRLAEEKQDHARWSVLFGAQAMVYGVVRFTHLQRSSLRSVEEWTLTFWCSKGKTSGTRQGFLWSMPRHTPQHYDLWPHLEYTLNKYCEISGLPLKSLQWLAVDLDAAKPLGIAGFIQCLQMWMQHCLDRPSSLSSYSLRRVAPTWAALAQLTDEQKLAIGNWTDQARVAVTPARYSAAKWRLSVQLKLSLLGGLRYFGTLERWQDVSLREAKAIFEQDMVASDIALASSSSTVINADLPSPGDNTLALRPSWIRVARARLAPRREALTKGESAPELPVETAVLAPAEVKASPPRPTVSLRPAVQSEDPDELFDALARERWSRPGHSNRPEPFSLVMQGSDGTGNVWLGGMPYADDLPFLRRQRIALLISCMKDCSCDERRGVSAATILQFSLPVGYNGRQRDDAWRDVRLIALATLRAGKSVLLHCRAGVHRGPVGCATLMGFVTRQSFDDCLNRISSQRAIDPQAVLNRMGGDAIMEWGRRAARHDVGQSLPMPWVWKATERRQGLWHVTSPSGTGPASPLCQWRQSADRAFFKGPTIELATTLEAAAHGDRRFCRGCAVHLPADEFLIIKECLSR